MDTIDHYRSTINKSTNSGSLRLVPRQRRFAASNASPRALECRFTLEMIRRCVTNRSLNMMNWDVHNCEYIAFWKNVCCMSLGPNAAACSNTRVSQVCALYAVALSLGNAQTSSHVWEVRWPCADARLCMFSRFQTTLVLETKCHWSGSVFFLAPFMFISLFLIFLASFVKCRPSSLLNSFWLFLPEVVSTIWWAPSKAPCSRDTTSINNPWAIHCQEIAIPSWSQKHEGLLQVCGGSPLTILDDDASVISDEPWHRGFSQAFKTMPVLPQHEKVLGQLSHDVSQVFLGKWSGHWKVDVHHHFLRIFL